MKSTDIFEIGHAYKSKTADMTVLCMSQTNTGFGGEVLSSWDERAFQKSEIFNSFNKGSFTPITTEDYLKPLNTFDISQLNISKSNFIKAKKIEIADITPNQLTLDFKHLQAKIKGTIKASDIYVLKYKGLFILIDGHHTVISKKLKGLTKVKAKYLEIQQL